MIRSDEKILERPELAGRLDSLRDAGRKLVLTNGCFDLLHVGHLRYLFAARQLGDCLIVAINADESIKRIKGPSRPILSADQRQRVLAGLECVDFVTTFHEDTPHNLLNELRPDILVKGATYTIDGVVGREVVEGYGGRVMTVELTEGKSSSAIIETVHDQSA